MKENQHAPTYRDGWHDGSECGVKSQNKEVKAWAKRMRADFKGDRSDWARGYRRALDNLEAFLKTGEDP